MRVLFSGYKNPHFQAVTDYIETALKDMGHEVLYFDYRSYSLPGRLRERMAFLENWDLGKLNRRLAEAASAFRPDLFLACGGYTIEPRTVAAIRRSGAVCAAWYADYPLLFERYLELAGRYDRFFTSGTDALERHRAHGNLRGSWLPFACLPDLHRPVALEPGDKALYESDVAFVGTAYPERVLFLEKLADFKLALWGPGWDRLPRGHKLRPFVRGGSLRTEEWLKAFSAAKVSLNLIQSFGSSLRDDQVTMANSRCFELLGCGAFQLVDAKRDIRTLFKSGRELVWFSSAGEAAESMRHYLAHDEERRSVGTRAREAALASHTYRDRLTELLRACGK